MAERRSSGRREGDGVRAVAADGPLIPAVVPPVTPCNGINHPLGGGHPDAVTFSTHIMEEFGGPDAVRRDFGGYLMMYSDFLDRWWAYAEAIKFDDRDPAEKKMRQAGWDQHHAGVPMADWESDEVQAMLYDLTMSARYIGEMLGVSTSAVQQQRQKRGIKRSRGRAGHDLRRHGLDRRARVASA